MSSQNATPAEAVSAPSTAATTRGERRRQRKATLAESEAVAAANLAKRLRAPVIITGVEMARTITLIRPDQFGKLGVDERYQRVRIGSEVNDIIHVLREGGEIPDPIDVAERPDGSWWIIDGQQRYWAHEETSTPLRALIHKVPDHNCESNLFVVLNSRRKVQPTVITKGWPGLTGDFIRKLNTDPKSPLWGLIDMGTNHQLPIDAATLVKGILVVTTGLESTGGDTATVVLPRTDAALKIAGRIAWAEAFAQLVALVFFTPDEKGLVRHHSSRTGQRVRTLPLQALAYVAHEKYKDANRPVFPKTCALLRRVNWDTLVPSHARQYMPILIQEIEKRWRK